jgi:hypothetical protein
VSPLSDEDVDRIARRVVWKLLLYGIAIVVVLFIGRYVAFEVFAMLDARTSGNAFLALLPLTMVLVALPALLLMRIWGRSRRSR